LSARALLAQRGALPGGRVTFAIERERKDGVEPVAVFRFLSEDWSPWIALLRMRERWPELRFEMKAEYLEMNEEDALLSGFVCVDMQGD
jgi:hypothetical protein